VLPESKTRAPIDVVVSMDISGSMGSYNKLNLCKTTCEILVGELGHEDQFGLTVFSTNVRVVFPLQKMNEVNKTRALSCIKALKTEGQTNLSGGLTCAINELQGSAQKNEVRSIMLLTDGHANQGVTDPESIVRLTKTCLAPTPNVSVNVFGYGCDHNADLLRSISEASVTKGSYYFVESNDDVSSAFGDCLGGLLSVAAQNIIVKIKGMGINALHDNAVKISADTYEVNLGDMFAEESKDILIEVENLGSGNQHEIEAMVSYVDIFSMKPTVTDTVVGIIARPEGAEIGPLNGYVSLQIMRVHVAKAMTEANVLGQQGNMDAGKKKINEMILKISQLKASFKPTEAEQAVINNFEKDLNEALKTLSTSVAEYQFRGSKNMYSKVQTHSCQRSNEASEAHENLYRGSTKSAMACRMKKIMKGAN
jgi:Ca-activated chloride channel family protein